MSPLEREAMNREAIQLAAEAWNTVKADDEPEYQSIALSGDFRHSLNDATIAAMKGEARSGNLALEKFEDEVHRRLREQRDVPVVEEKPKAEKSKTAKKGK